MKKAIKPFVWTVEILRKKFGGNIPLTQMDKAIWTVSLPLLLWGVTETDALKTAESWMITATERGIKAWTDLDNAPNMNPAAIAITSAHESDLPFSAELIEHAIFATHGDDISRLADAVTRCPAVHKRFEADSTDFWKRLAKYVGQKRAGPAWVNNQPAWVQFAVKNWMRGSDLPPTYPPVCLWADSAIQTVFADAPREANGIRVYLKRACKLHRPEGFAFRLCNDKWVKCKRKHSKGVT